ncbi:MAG: pro-sigmaK processing inhibitor BofA family protein [Thermoflavifilum sp.]|nr:pro-sigmaK processing inhibitor BofA family protein [Thermoflavifilum sp.]MCL6515126.1 pro-sigmaK processing inhibitor BofA family protein [Alicyclobacillus sp.]
MDKYHLLAWGLAGLAGAVVLSVFFKAPGAALWRLVRSVVVGCLLILAVNWVGGHLHYHMPLNPVTALVAGFLGIPGLAAIAVVQLWVMPGAAV